MTQWQLMITFLIFFLGIVLARSIIFLLFPAGKEIPQFIIYLGRVLPTATIGLIIIYSLKDIPITKSPYLLPELLAIILVIIINRVFKQQILSIILGTIFYMFLVQIVF